MTDESEIVKAAINEYGNLPSLLKYAAWFTGAILTTLMSIAAVFFKRILSKIDLNATENAAMTTANNVFKNEINGSIDSRFSKVNSKFSRHSIELGEHKVKIKHIEDRMTEAVERFSAAQDGTNKKLDRLIEIELLKVQQPPPPE